MSTFSQGGQLNRIVLIHVIPEAKADPHLDRTSKSDASNYLLCFNGLYEYVKEKCIFD